MKNWKSEFQINYHVNFLMEDATMITKYEGIVIEDKTNEEKNISHEFKPSEIFKASDLMVDSLTQLIAKKRSKNN